MKTDQKHGHGMGVGYSYSPLRRRLLGSLACGAAGALGGPSVFAADTLTPAHLDRLLAKLDGLARTLMATSGIPGMSVAVVHGQQTVFARGYGVTNVQTRQPVDADTVFQLASVSKSVGATAIAALVGQGLVKWDTPLQTLLPWFELSDANVARQVTIADLYAHRSGLPGHCGDELEEMGVSQADILKRFKYLPLASFRKDYAYGNFDITAAAVGAATTAKNDWATVSEQMLYLPLGMKRTTSRYADFSAQTNTATGHLQRDGHFVPYRTLNKEAQAPAGGVYSTANDLGRWMSMVLGLGMFNGRWVCPPSALQPALMRHMKTSDANKDLPASYYGYGFVVSTTEHGRTTYKHSGAFTAGASTQFTIVPALNLGIAVLTNAVPTGVPEALAAQFLDVVEFGALRKDWPKIWGEMTAPLAAPWGAKLRGKVRPAPPVPARPLPAYAGVYTNDYFGPLQVTVENNALVLTLGPRPTTIRCSPWGGDTFFYMPTDLEAPQGSIFAVEFSGKHVTLEEYDAIGQGKFTLRSA